MKKGECAYVITNKVERFFYVIWVEGCNLNRFIKSFVFLMISWLYSSTPIHVKSPLVK